MNLNRRDFVVGSTATAALLTSQLSSTAQSTSPKLKTVPFQLGIVTYNVAANWDLPTILKVCKTVGIAAVECRTTHKHGVEPTLNTDERKAIKKQFNDSGVVFWGSGSTCEFHAADPGVVKKNVETCKTFIQLVADLGGKGVKVRPNGIPKNVSIKKTLSQIGTALKEVGDVAKNAGVEIWVEVHGAVTQEPVHMKTIMEQTAHPSVGLTWNSNPTDVKDGSVKPSFDLLKSWIKSVHINEIYKDAASVYPYREFFGLLRSINYDRYTMIEVARTPTDVASGEEMLRYYKALWTMLAQG